MAKKGSLSISTNAIVVLIIAVIMLALIISLVTNAFGMVERRFIEGIEQTESPPAVPDSVTPITLSSLNKIVSRGEYVGFRVHILNTDVATTAAPGQSLQLRPAIKCVTDVFTGTVTTVFQSTGVADRAMAGGVWFALGQSVPKSLQLQEYGYYVWMLQVSGNAPPGQHICEVRAANPSGATGWIINNNIKSTEITVTVER